MNQTIGTVLVTVTAHPTPGKFTHKLVIAGLRPSLGKGGVEVDSAQTTESGRGSELAVRANLARHLVGPITFPLSVQVVDFSERRKAWNSLVVLDGCRSAMARVGAPILATEKTSGGRGGEIATRVVARKRR